MKPNAFFICLLLSVITVSSCTTNRVKEEDPKPVLLISFDGFRHDYLDFTDTPHFDSLSSSGVRVRRLIPVFPSKTFPNHYSIVTGLYPEHTGLVANTMYDPAFKEWYRIRDRAAVENEKWYGGEPIWNTVEKQGLRAGTMFWVGSEAPIQGMRPTYWKRYDGDMPNRARIDTVVKWLSAPPNKRVDLATLYFELVDDAGHYYGVGSDSLIRSIQQSDSLMGYLKERLRHKNLWEKLNVIVVSDHGMTNLSADKVVMLDEIIDLDDTERVIWDPVTMIQPKKGEGSRLYRALKEHEEGYTVYRREELPERYHLKSHRRVPDLLLVAETGYTILNEEMRERFNERLPAGTHGYENRDSEMHALFVARGPAFKQGVTVDPMQNVHIYELINILMDTEPAPNDGSADSVQVMLQ